MMMNRPYSFVCLLDSVITFYQTLSECYYKHATKCVVGGCFLRLTLISLGCLAKNLQIGIVMVNELHY